MYWPTSIWLVSNLVLSFPLCYFIRRHIDRKPLISLTLVDLGSIFQNSVSPENIFG
jgi:hypothetical protein